MMKLPLLALLIASAMYCGARVMWFVENALDIFIRCYDFGYWPYRWCDRTPNRTMLPSEALVFLFLFLVCVLAIVILGIDNSKNDVLY